MKMYPQLSRELGSVLSVSVSFMLMFGSVGTLNNMQKVLVNSMAQDAPPTFAVDGYTVTAVTYCAFASSLWIGPYVACALGAKTTMVIASVGYLLMVGSLAVERAWVVYSGAAVGGLAAGALYPAHVHYMICNSTPRTTAGNFAIFQLILTSSSVIGNLIVFYKFQGKTYIDQSTRTETILCLVAINAISVLAFLSIPKLNRTGEDEYVGLIETMKNTIRLLKSRRMFWLAIVYCYTGMEQAFYTGIYSPSIGFTLEFGDSVKQLVPLSGIFIGLGSMLGALLPVALSQRRLPVVVCGVVSQSLTFLIAYVNLPDAAVFGDTTQTSLVRPSAALAMFGSVMLGLGDSCLVTQEYAIIGEFYKDCSAEACALYKFIKAVMVALSFFSSSRLGLHTQATILAVSAVIALVSFFFANNSSNIMDINPEARPLLTQTPEAGRKS